MLSQLEPQSDMGDVLEIVDETIRALNYFQKGIHRSEVQKLCQIIDRSLDKILSNGWNREYVMLNEVVYYLELACFSLLNLNGEYFHTYLEELNKRYKAFLHAA